MPRHVFRGSKETLALWPDLPPSVRFSATYHDAWISHPERLGIELILDGLAANCAMRSRSTISASTRREGGRIVAGRRALRRGTRR